MTPDDHGEISHTTEFQDSNMNTISQSLPKSKLFGATLVLAALAMAIALMLTLTGNPAVPAAASTTPVDGDGVSLLTQHHDHDDEPHDPVPEGTVPDCSLGADAVVASGQIALFDVYWDEDNQLLTNNPCPPETVNVAGEAPKPLNPTGTPARTDRYASEVNIGETTIHIPDSAKHELSTEGTDRWNTDIYPFLLDADTDGHGDSDGFVWIVPECPESGDLPGGQELCINFSAATLRTADWDGDIQFEFEAIREPGIGFDDRGYVYVFETSDGDPHTNDEITWTTKDVDTNQLAVTPGEYQTRHWAFSRPGTYVFRVHAKVRVPIDADTPISDDDSVSSDVAHYTFHVGALSELTVDLSNGGVEHPPVGQDVTFTVTVNNEGPAAAGNAQGHFDWPGGLSYVSSTTDTGTYDPATGVWSIGTLDAPESAEEPTTAELSLVARVNPNTHGISQTLGVCMTATETIGDSEVDELDPHGHHHCDSETVTPPPATNSPALFSVGRFPVREGTAPYTQVGDSIPIFNADGDALHITLSGDNWEDFYVELINGEVQLKLSHSALLDPRVIPSYDLTISVSDHKDSNGNYDPSIDSAVAVHIYVTWDPNNLP